LSPGNYLIWARRGDEKTTIVPQTIGGAGEKKVSVDLIVADPVVGR
jgi:hypothetical protein